MAEAEIDGELPDRPSQPDELPSADARHAPSSPPAAALQQTLVDLADPLVADHGAELVDVEVSGSGSLRIRVLVHREEGVTIDLCETISRELSDVLDVEDPVPGRYRLEVTSPGLDRPLRTDADFRRARDRRLKVITRDGRTSFGRLVAFDEAAIELGGDAGLVVERGQIARATIEVEF